MKRQIQIISAPSVLGLKSYGVERLPAALLNAGLASKIDSIQTIIEVSTLNHKRDERREAATDCLNPAAIEELSLSLMPVVAEQIRRQTFPLVLGGDCSILIGIMAGLKQQGKFGLLFVDAHADFYQPAASVTGEVADMDLAIVTGRGPSILTDINNLRPYVEDENVIHIGQRDEEETKRHGSQDIRNSGMTLFDLATIRERGIENVVADIIIHMHHLSLDGFWIHFDTDVISDAENPAVDYRLPGGLTFKEAGWLLNQLVQTGRIMGMGVTIYNPALDKDGTVAVRITDCLAIAFEEYN